MDFYLSINGEKQGPFGLLKVGDLFESGEITKKTLGWHQGLEEWKPIGAIDALESVLRERKTEAPDSESGLAEPPPLPKEGDSLPEGGAVAISAEAPLPEVVSEEPGRPFLRFWARAFDYLLVSVSVFIFTSYSFPQIEPGEAMADFFARYMEYLQSPEARNVARVQIFALIAWHFVEGVLIHLIGTTPGKAILGITVMTEDRYRVPVLRSIGRSFFVYFLGVGFYLFPFNIIGMIFSFFRIMATGRCLWDQQLRLAVETKKLSSVRIVLAIGAFFVLLMLPSVKM
jgi:uncharacterized RDD family membrane protein YckC